jgi:hypothetical protein
VKTVLVVVIVALMLPSLWACTSDSSSGAGSTPASSPTPAVSPAAGTTSTVPVGASPGSGSDDITGGNVGSLRQVASGRAQQPFTSLTWRADDHEVYAVRGWAYMASRVTGRS